MLKEVPYSDTVTSYLVETAVSTGTFLSPVPNWAVYLQANTGYWIDFIGKSESVGDGISIQMSFSGTVLFSSLLMEFTEVSKTTQVGVLTPVLIGDFMSSYTLNEVWHCRGFVRTAAGGRLTASFGKIIDFSGDTSVLAGSALTARSLGGGGASGLQVSEDRILTEDSSIVLLETGYSLVKE